MPAMLRLQMSASKSGKGDRVVYRALPARDEAKSRNTGNALVDLQLIWGQLQVNQCGEEQLGVKVRFKRGWGKALWRQGRMRATEENSQFFRVESFSIPHNMLF